MHANIEDRLKSIDDGIFYPILNAIVCGMRFLSLVEGFKFLAGLIPGSKDNTRRFNNIAIDIFIVAKWALVVYFWAFGYHSTFTQLTIWYLIITNLHTYFYYHVWVNIPSAAKTRERRRFSNAILAFAFSVISYGYFYDVCYSNHFELAKGVSREIGSIMFSLGTALTGFTGSMSPIDGVGYFIVATQLIGTFMFLTIIISQSIPELLKTQNK